MSHHFKIKEEGQKLETKLSIVIIVSSEFQSPRESEYGLM